MQSAFAGQVVQYIGDAFGQAWTVPSEYDPVPHDTQDEALKHAPAVHVGGFAERTV